MVAEPLRSILELFIGGGGLTLAISSTIRIARNSGAMHQWKKQIEEAMEKMRKTCVDHSDRLTEGSKEFSQIQADLANIGKAQDEHGGKIDRLSEVVYKIAGKLGINGYGR